MDELNTLKNKFKDPETIFLYEMGGVDALKYKRAIPSSVLFNTLYNNYPCYVVFDQFTNSAAKRAKLSVQTKTKLDAIKNRNRTKIITFVRNPLDRNIASFFFDFGYWMFEYSCKTREDQRIHSNVGTIISVFDTLFNHNYALNWFDNEIKQLTGIDVYEHQFNKEQGWSVIANDNYELLIIQFEKLNQMNKVLSEFTQQDIDITMLNTQTPKWYDNIFNDFIEHYQPSSDYLNMLFTSAFASHFYSKTDLEYFQKSASH